MMTLANFVKTKRKEVNLTQEEFAERAGVALTVIRKIEQGKENLNMDSINKMGTFTEVSLEEIFGY